MKTSFSNLCLALSLVLAAGCGARTPLDLEADQSPSPASGGATSRGGGAGGRTIVGVGGTLGAGGFGGGLGVGGASYSTVCPPFCPLQAGTLAGVGGFGPTGGTGGAVPFGGLAVGGRTIATGGTVPFGGTTYGPFGGSTIVGGRGTVPFGGTIVGGRGTVPFGGTGPLGGLALGGSAPGGAVSFGGLALGGRTIVTGGAVSFGGLALGGRTVATGGTLPIGGTAGYSIVGGTGAGGSGGMGGTTACQGLAANEESIDDLNDGDRFIPQVHGRAGAWSDSDDSTPGATMYPDPVGSFTPTFTGDACRKYAAYVYGGPFVLWGASLLFGLGSPYDAFAYDGITFWAKIDAGTSQGLRVAFPDKDTQPDGGLCQTNVTGPTECFDHYGKRINLTTTWTKYTIDFTSLSQDGWGRQGTSFDRRTLYQVLFQIPVNGNFGIWIDDVAFTTTPLLPL